MKLLNECPLIIIMEVHKILFSSLFSGDEVVYHKYYQWVCYVLFFQAGLFYIPRFLWKTIEGGRMQMLVSVKFDRNSKIVFLKCLFSGDV